MTHDELLAMIDYLQVEGAWDIPMGSKRFEMIAKNYRSLRAVVELHHPGEVHFGDVISEILCLECEVKYPCKTIQAIEKELK